MKQKEGNIMYQKIRWILNVILILLAISISYVAFVPNTIQMMYEHMGPKAYMVFPYLLLAYSVLLFIRLNWKKLRQK